MPQVPVLTPREVIRVFESYGWRVVRQKGSHIMLTCPGKEATLSIPDHNEVGRGLLRGQIRKAGLTIDEYIDRCNELL
jgi:predicted RNA binding protein YcfA (HicA-like mRNA interferase family)